MTLKSKNWSAFQTRCLESSARPGLGISEAKASLKYKPQISLVNNNNNNNTPRRAGGLVSKVQMTQRRKNGLGERGWWQERSPRSGKPGAPGRRMGGIPGTMTTPKGTSCECEACPRWQRGDGPGGVLSSQPPLRALCTGFLSRWLSVGGGRWGLCQGASPNLSPRGAVSLDLAPEHLAYSLGGRCHVDHITGGQLGDIRRSFDPGQVRDPVTLQHIWSGAEMMIMTTTMIMMMVVVVIIIEFYHNKQRLIGS